LKLKFENLLSGFAFKFRLRRYTTEAAIIAALVGRCSLNL